MLCQLFSKHTVRIRFFDAVKPMAVSARKGKAREANKYEHTVSLPQTEFGMRANSLVREPEIQSFWEELKIYESLVEGNAEGTFTLHDGPPYANGDLHCGHALNKILKDFINKYQLMKGKKAKYVPGWDTHGLPVELKVLQTLSMKERALISALDLRSKAANFAMEAVQAQREQFKRFGVWADWETPYLTLSPEYEAAQLDVFSKMVKEGNIYRGRKPVHWSPSSRTALAESELEYPEGHTSQSCYVALETIDNDAILGEDVTTHLAIWTTTPWTLPANRAVAVNKDLDYAIVEMNGATEGQPQRLVIASELLEKLEEKFGLSFRLVASVKGEQLEGLEYKHPFKADLIQPVVIGGDYITTESGTGLVHTAPGHGQEDFVVGLKYDLEVFSPVDESGTFTEAAGQFSGMKVLSDGNKAVLDALEENGMLLKQEPYQHKYPYDWRTKKPIIFRATDQWFASIDRFREAALTAIQSVSWYPAGGINRITAMTKSRSDWCISRQRRWGLPIPAFYDLQTGEPLMTEQTIQHVRKIVAKHGSDAWWKLSIEELLPEEMAYLAPTLRKGEDTMDVWFDSGTSWAAVLQEDHQLQFPSDLYLEGSDQHRGWFQSSLLTSVATTGIAPYKQVLTHGFVLDDKGRKMSKSLGNVIDPRYVIQGGNNKKQEPAYGADVLRLWVASVDYTADVMIGKGILKQTADVYKKIRGTLRFLLGNLYDFEPSSHGLPIGSLPKVDRYILSKLHHLCQESDAAYAGFQFSRFYALVQRFVSADLSNFYLDIAKDRLYIQSTDSFSRRACQTVLHELMHGLVSYIAPVLPHLAEDVWKHLPYESNHDSVFQAGWLRAKAEWKEELSEEESQSFDAILRLRELVTKALETARDGKFIGSSLEAKLLINVPDPSVFEAAFAENGVDELQYSFIVSQAQWTDTSSAKSATYCTEGQVDGVGDVVIGVEKADGLKCERCWNYSTSVGTFPDTPDLCHRCAPIVTTRPSKPGSTTTELLAEKA